MALAGLPMSLIAAAASLLVSFISLPALAATTSDLAVTMAVDDGTGVPALDCDKSTPPVCTPITSNDVAPGDDTTFDIIVTRPETTEARPMLLTFTFTIPAGSDFIGLSGCDTDPKFDPTVAIVCTITDPYAFNADKDAFGTKVTAQITVERHFSTKDPIPATCPTGDLGNVTVVVTSDSTDPNAANNTASNDLTLDPYADLAVTASAPATATTGGTLEVKGTVKNLGPCDAPNVQITEEVSDGAGVSNLTYKSGTGACANVTDYELNGCAIATLPVGTTTAFSVIYGVDSVAVSGANSTVRTSGFNVVSGYTHVDPSTTPATKVKHPGISDPNGANNSIDTSTTVPLSSGCSTSGSTGALALLAIGLALSLRKRRNS